METILELHQVSGGYSLNKPVLHDLSFQVHKGEMVGLIGLNGAGKSTTMKHILGLLRQQKGTIRIKGKTLEQAPEQYRASYVYVPESPLLYEELTVTEHLELTAMAYGLNKKNYLSRSEKLLEEFQMTSHIHQFSVHLSKGMKQKMMIMCAFLVQPDLYIIDEPFLGLDPLGIRSLLELMVKMKQSGASFLISSHILSTIENYCERFIIMHRGKLLVTGEIDEVQRASSLSQNASLEEMFYALVKDGK